MHRADSGIVLGLYRSGHDRQLLEDALSLGVRAIDTAANYLAFTSHRTLAHLAADLLSEFTISTKVGFHRSGHSLNPAALYESVEQSVTDLGRAPNVVLLHNPEHTLGRRSRDEGRELLAAACEALEDATKAGLCKQWGFSIWNPHPLLPLIDSTAPTPKVLMTRAGLLVDADTLAAVETLTAVLAIDPSDRWGMAPFGGDTTLEVWRAFDTRTFLSEGDECTTVQAAFRVSYEMPKVARIAVGTSSPSHLRALVDATTLGVDLAVVSRYRALLNERAAARS